MTITFMIVIMVTGKPAPKGSYSCLAKGRGIDANPNVKVWTKLVKTRCEEWREAQGDAWNGPLDGPVSVDVSFFTERSATAQRRGDPYPANRAGGGDIDKLLRSTLDAVTNAGLWVDDCQVVLVAARKLWALPAPGGGPARPGALIRIEPVTGPIGVDAG